MAINNFVFGAAKASLKSLSSFLIVFSATMLGLPLVVLFGFAIVSFFGESGDVLPYLRALFSLNPVLSFLGLYESLLNGVVTWIATACSLVAIGDVLGFIVKNEPSSESPKIL